MGASEDLGTILGGLLPPDVREIVSGNLLEEYRGSRRAVALLFVEALGTPVPGAWQR